MRTLKTLSALATTFLFVTACSQSNFSGDSGNSARSGNSIPKKPCTGPSCGPVTPSTPVPPGPTPPDGLSTDNGGTAAVVDATLKIIRNGDGAHYQNCLYANIIGQPESDLGCNRPGIYPAKYGTLPVPDATLKVLSNTCNVLSLKLRTNSGAGLKDNVSTTTSPSRFIITKTGPGQFTIKANDNNDQNWNDLSLTITANSAIKYTIEGSNIPCDP